MYLLGIRFLIHYTSIILPVGDQLALKMKGSTEITPIPGTEFLRGAEKLGAQLKAQIPWLRVFVEGVVIVGGRQNGRFEPRRDNVTRGAD